MGYDNEMVADLLIHQLRNYWNDFKDDEIRNAVPKVLEIMRGGYVGQINDSFLKKGINPYNSVQWCLFLYRMSRYLYVNRCDNDTLSADIIFYLNKIMNSVNWNYKAELPMHFSCEHPLGSVLGRAEYGDYLFIYQGVTVGGNRSRGELSFPVIGDNVIFYTDSKVIGKSHIGSNVVVAANTYIFNTDVPDNCIVSGRSPDLVIKTKSEFDIKRYTSHIWKWKDDTNDKERRIL